MGQRQCRARQLCGAAVIVWLLSGSLSTSASASESDGASLYHEFCSVCHGDRGDGRSRARAGMSPPPRDFTKAGSLAELSLARMLTAVREGRPGTAMAGWSTQLRESEIEAVVAYIRGDLMSSSALTAHARGEKVYAENCAVCHGDDGRGARWTATNLEPRPRNFTRAETRFEISRAQMIHAATYGKPDTAMPGFTSQLSREDLEGVVDFILATFVPTADPNHGPAGDGNASSVTRVAAVSTGVDMELPMPNGLVGDVIRGAGLYMANCVACHGAEGDGRGPRAYFILPKPRNFQHPGSRQSYNRPVLYQAVARGSVGAEMPAWDTVFDGQQIADVSEFVFKTFIRDAVVGSGAAR